MRRLALVVLAGCAHPAPLHPVASPPPPAPAPAVSPWTAVPVRVMAWTARGVQQIGALPGTLPQPMPALWFVEPVGRLDAAKLTALVALVRDEHVPGLSLRGQPVAPWLATLTALPELRALVLDDTDVDGAALARAELAVTRLHLARTAIDDAAVAMIGERFPGLEAIDLEGTAVGDVAARSLAALGTLHAINLSGTRVSDDGGAALGALHELAIADLGRTRVGAKTVAALRTLPLHELFVDGTRIAGEVATLAALVPTLERFDISGTEHHPTDAELKWLATAPNLVEVGLGGAKVHDLLALQLAKAPLLRELRLASNPITVATIRVIAARTDLEEVDLAETPVDDASAAALVAAPHMRLLRLDLTPITDAALAATPSSTLVELYVSHTRISDRGAAILDQLPGLVGLGLGATQIGDPTLVRIATLTALETLVLSKTHATAATLARLGALHALVRLYLDGTHADDAVLAALAPAAVTLRVLHLAGSEISEAGLPALRVLGGLTELTLGDTRMHSGITDLSAWPRLQTLSLVGIDLADWTLVPIARHASLVTLDLSATDIHDPSPLVALDHLRLLGVAQTQLSARGEAALKTLTARGVEVVR